MRAYEKTMTYLKRVESPEECPYHHPVNPYCSKVKGLECFSGCFPHDCPLEIVDDEEFEE